MTTYISIIIFGILFGGLGSYFVVKSAKNKLNKQKESILQKAKTQVSEIKNEAQSDIKYQESVIADLDKEFQSFIPVLEDKIDKKQNFLKKRESKLSQINHKISESKDSISKTEESLKDITSDTLSKLSQKAEKSVDETKESIKSDLKNEFQKFYAKEIQSYANHISDISVKKAQEDLKVIMQKYTEPSSTDRLDKHFELLSPKEALRLAGPDSTNFKYIKDKLDVDIEIDEVEPNVVRVSGFILWKQEIAKLTLDKLTKLSHIDQPIIDKVIQQSTDEMNQHLESIGKDVAKEIQLESPSKELLNILGRLQYRTSYGQNILFHSFEVAYFSQIIANMLGEDPRVAFLAGFFHDVGKAIDQEQEGTHDLLGKEFLESQGFDYEIYHPAHSHHYLVPVETTIGEIVIIADKISAGRPGARAESAEMYYERVKGLERIAAEYEGVKKAYAISAGREIRTFLDENKVSDKDMDKLAQTIAHQVESELTYPGQIKVNLIRTVQSSDYANKK